MLIWNDHFHSKKEKNGLEVKRTNKKNFISRLHHLHDAIPKRKMDLIDLTPTNKDRNGTEDQVF